MVVRYIIRLTITIVAIGYAMPLSASVMGEFLANVASDTNRRNCWPEPYIHPDRATVRQTLAVQVSAGWERQNLLSEFHFLPGENELTEAGRMRVQWIMNEVPESHRQIYVHRANTPQGTILRMQTVQRFIAQSPYAANVPVLESTRTDDGCPADRIDWLSRKAASSALEPKLMGSSGGSSGGSGGSGH